jgi:uncharacterized protein (DUF427 family)
MVGENPQARSRRQRRRSSTKKLKLIIVEEIIMRAIWNNAVLAQGEDTVVVEGNHYFPPEALNREYFKPGDKHTVCPWKGEASDCHIVVDGKVNENAAWHYPETIQAAENITGRLAFYRVVAHCPQPNRFPAIPVSFSIDVDPDFSGARHVDGDTLPRVSCGTSHRSKCWFRWIRSSTMFYAPRFSRDRGFVVADFSGSDTGV